MPKTIFAKADVLLTKVAARKLLGLGYYAMEELIKTGSIPYLQIGKSQRFKRDVLEQWLKERD